MNLLVQMMIDLIKRYLRNYWNCYDLQFFLIFKEEDGFINSFLGVGRIYLFNKMYVIFLVI